MWTIEQRKALPYWHSLAIPRTDNTEKHCRDPHCPDTNWGGEDRLHSRDDDICPDLDLAQELPRERIEAWARDHTPTPRDIMEFDLPYAEEPVKVETMSNDKIVLDPRDPDVITFIEERRLAIENQTLTGDLPSAVKIAKKIAEQMPVEQPEEPKGIGAVVQFANTRLTNAVGWWVDEHEGNLYTWNDIIESAGKRQIKVLSYGIN